VNQLHANNLPSLLSRSGARSPDTPAITDGVRSVSYLELDSLAWKMAWRLRSMGVQSGDRVAVSMPKSINAVVSLLGAMRAGAAYVPIDFSAPADRNRYIAQDCDVRAICVDEPRADVYRSERGPAMLVFPGVATDGIGADWLDRQPSTPFEPQPNLDDLAYILYTSGSTGTPKGVMHSQRSAVSFVAWAASLVRPEAGDRFSSHAPFHFDLSILDLYVPLSVGATIVLVSEAVGKVPRQLSQYIAEQRITTWYSVPSILALMSQYGDLPAYDFSSLRTVLFAGEVFPIQHLRALKQLWREQRFVNLYGPTETNVCTYYRIPNTIDNAREKPFPIGKPCENVRAMVVDDSDWPVHDGEEGQLLIHQSGPTMRGYWNLAEQTEGSFFVDANGERWYRTGDVVKPDENGDWDFIGRRDRMVKRHGYRIELGEIEAAMYRHADVREVAATAVAQSDGLQIRAYLATKAGQKLSIIALKQFCAANLPAYMIPDQFLFVEQLPRTSTDKIDYQSLQFCGPPSAASDTRVSWR
jgi:amino acid adenylation domain-containing protein